MPVFRIVFLATVGLLVSACATTQPVDLNAFLVPDPRLPRLEHVELMATLAIQKVVAAAPGAAQALQAADSFAATSAFVTILFRTPIDQLAATPAAFEVALLSLAHQWGRTQIVLDYVSRYDKLLAARHEELKRKQRDIAWSNFFLGLSTVAYGISNAYTDPMQRLSNELGLARNQQAMELNQKLSTLYESRGQNLEDTRLQLAQVKQTLISYSNLLEIYVRWLLSTARDRAERLSPEAVRILEVKALI